MPKTNAQICREYRERKKKVANKIKKITMSSTERVRNFRARQRALRSSSVSNIQNTEPSTSEALITINSYGDYLITKMQTAEIETEEISIKLPREAEELESHPSCSNVPNNNDDGIVHSASLKYTLFERIYTETVIPRMPNGAWAIHRSLLPTRTIVASELGGIGENHLEIAPLYIKQIVFDSKLNFEVFFMNTRTVLKDKPGVPDSLSEFENILAYISEIKLCPGGPAVVKYSNISLECAYKDPTEKWRHNLCSLEIVDELACKSCFSLQEILQRHIQRKKLAGRTSPYLRKGKRKVGSRRGRRV